MPRRDLTGKQSPTTVSFNSEFLHQFRLAMLERRRESRLNKALEEAMRFWMEEASKPKSDSPPNSVSEKMAQELSSDKKEGSKLIAIDETKDKEQYLQLGKILRSDRAGEVRAFLAALSAQVEEQVDDHRDAGSGRLTAQEYLSKINEIKRAYGDTDQIELGDPGHGKGASRPASPKKAGRK